MARLLDVCSDNHIWDSTEYGTAKRGVQGAKARMHANSFSSERDT